MRMVVPMHSIVSSIPPAVALVVGFIGGICVMAILSFFDAPE